MIVVAVETQKNIWCLFLFTLNVPFIEFFVCILTFYLHLYNVYLCTYIYIYHFIGLYEYICTSLRLSEYALLKREVIVHEMMITDNDLVDISYEGKSPWRKRACEYRRKEKDVESVGFPNVRRVEMYSKDGVWSVYGDEKVSSCAYIDICIYIFISMCMYVYFICKCCFYLINKNIIRCCKLYKRE